MSTALPSRPRGFKVIVERIPNGKKTRWISNYIIELGLGKIAVNGGIVPHHEFEYSVGDKDKWWNNYNRVIVTFESTISEELRTALEDGYDIKQTYASKGDTAINKRTGVEYKNDRDKHLLIKQYKPREETTRQSTIAAEKIRQSAIHEKQKMKKQHKSTGQQGNRYAALM